MRNADRRSEKREEETEKIRTSEAAAIFRFSLRAADFIEGTQVSAMDRAASSAESEIIFMT